MPITQQVFLKEWTVGKAMVKYRDCKTELACIDTQAPTIKQVEMAYGYDFVQAYIESWIVNLRMFFNVGRAMTDAQTFETAMLIVDTFPCLNMADINLVFKKAKSGYFGQIYDRIDGNVIMGWFHRYFDERCERAAERSQREADSMRIRCPETKERLERIINDLNKK